MPQNDNFLALSTIWLYQVRRAWADTACIDRLSIIGLVLAIVAIEGDYVSIEIQDDGAGIDPERLCEIARNKGLIDAEAAARLSTDECLHLIFMPGFSTNSTAAPCWTVAPTPCR